MSTGAADPPAPQAGPLSATEIAELEATLLPALERHHLRLLAHGLRTLQAIAGRRQGQPPDRQAIAAWAGRQPAIAGDGAFIQAFTAQLATAAEQLTAIAAPGGGGALDLDLPELIAWARARADARLG